MELKSIRLTNSGVPLEYPEREEEAASGEAGAANDGQQTMRGTYPKTYPVSTTFVPFRHVVPLPAKISKFEVCWFRDGQISKWNSYPNFSKKVHISFKKSSRDF